MTKTKLYIYCFRTAMTSPKSWKFLDFQVELTSRLVVVSVKTYWIYIHFTNLLDIFINVNSDIQFNNKQNT